MKKIFFYVFFVVSFFLFTLYKVNAATYQAKLTGNSVSLRSGPGTNYSRIASLALGSTYNLLDTNKYPNEQGCSDGWYKIAYGTSSGYVCATYVQVITINENTTGNATTSCEVEMANAGFPSSYWGKLCALKEQHPAWSFRAINTNLDWATAVEKESECGESYVQTSNSEYIDTSCVSAYSSTSSWKPASQKAVAYYMDPRNFLTERYIFQFEYLRYDNNLSGSYVNGSVSILKNAQFFIYHSPNGNELSQTINTAGMNTDVNPIFLSSRMLNELGNGTAEYSLYSGVYDGYDNQYYGYYNFFNYGVSDSCANTYGIAYCGLTYAKNKGWNSPYNAIAGASSLLSSSYIAVGQYTNYLQKFNVVPTNLAKLYNHQYMTNIAAPSSESSSAYNTYNKLGLLNSAFVFYIPIFNNMDNTITNTSSGAVADPSGGSTSTSSMPISTIVTSSGFSYTSNYISKIEPGSDVATIKGAIESVSGNGTVTITNASGAKVTSGVIGTGYKVSITNNSQTEVLEAVIKGDTSGDGVVNALDLLQVQKNILGTYSLNGSYNKAADTSSDGNINALDLLQVQKHILGTYTIGQ